jgi:hypothetical protein
LNNARKLDVPAIECPVCGEGKAALFEALDTGKIREPKTGGPVEASCLHQFRLCDHCECEFAGHEESRYNLAQYKAVLAEHGPIDFPRENVQA